MDYDPSRCGPLERLNQLVQRSAKMTSLRKGAGSLFCVFAMSCYSAEAPSDSAGRDAAPLDAAAPATDSSSGTDAGPWFDCAEACTRDPPICRDADFEGGPTCEDKCAAMTFVERRCNDGQVQTLVSCVLSNPGSCEDHDAACTAEWREFYRCSGY